MCDKTVGDYSIALEFVPDRYKSKEMCHKIISENPFMLKYCPDKYVTQKMFDEAVDDFLLLTGVLNLKNAKHLKKN